MTAPASLAARVLLWGLLGLSNTLWGASWVVAKIALRELTPLQLAAWRMILAGLVLLPVVVWYARQGSLPRRVWPQLAALGLAQAVLAKWFVFWGVQHSTAANAGLLMATEPAFTILLAALTLGERLTRARLGSLALGAAGAYLIVFQKTGWPSLSGATVAGDAVFLLGLLLEAVYSVGSKPLSRRYPPLAVASASLVVALPVWIPVAAWDVAVSGWPALSTGGWIAVAYFALGCTVFGYVVWVYALRHIDAGGVGLTVFLQPVVGTLLAVGILGERLTAATLAGAALVLVSLGVLLYAPAARSVQDGGPTGPRGAN
jgi:drug/metabolite transporter (DMT)-like permease